MSRWRESRYFLVSIVISVSMVAAAIGAGVTLLTQSFPTAPQPAVPIVHVTSLCNSSSNSLAQQANGSGVFTNASGTFITSGTSVAIRYFCTVSGTGVGNPAFSVVQEDPLKFASATPTITGLTGGTLNVEATSIPCTAPANSASVPLASGTSVTLGPGDYHYCLVIDSYTSQVQQFTVTWNAN